MANTAEINHWRRGVWSLSFNQDHIRPGENGAESRREGAAKEQPEERIQEKTKLPIARE